VHVNLRPTRRPQTAQEVALAELREMILTGVLHPGNQVIQDAVAVRLGVSRVPVREALKILEGEGLVSYSRHHGYAVTKLSLEELREIYRIRDLLEDEAIVNAVLNLSPSDMVEMAEANDQFTRAYAHGDVMEILEANRAFHDTIFRRGGTARLSNLIRILWDSTVLYRSQYFADPKYYAQQSKEHLEILDAAKAGDRELVLAASRAHRRQALVAHEELLRQEES
jgi:DNA-binding GntR family transcriptional regulator